MARPRYTSPMADHRTNAPAGWRKMEEGDLVQVVMDSVRNALDFYGDYESYRLGLAELTPGQIAVFATWWVEAEVWNGGWPQFFGNSTGMVAPEAVEGYRRFKMNGVARVVQSAIQFCEFSPYPRDRDERERRVPDYDANKDEWERLYEAFDEAMGGPFSPEDGAGPYIRAHPAEFFLP